VGIDVDWEQTAYLLAAIIPSIILHEVSHGWVALRFGDDTAKRAGRLTLNPIKHVDPFGTILLPALLSLSGVGAFGYAKPVPVTPRLLRNPRSQSLYVSLAGPAVNIALAALGYVMFQLTRPEDLGPYPMVPRYFFWFGFLNTLLAIFNLLPIPPLDGSALIERVLPHRWWPTWLKIRQYGFGILLLLVFLTDTLDVVFDPAVRWWEALL